MRSEVLERLRQGFTTPGALEALAERLGTDRRGVQRALTFGVPVALGGLQRAVSEQPDAWTRAATAMGEPESLGAVVAGGPTPTGEALLERAFGPRREAVTAALAAKAAIAPPVASGALSTLLPLTLLAARGVEPLTDERLADLLGTAAGESAASVPGGEASVAEVLAAAPPPPAPEPAPLPEPAARRPTWPLWAGGAAVAVVLVVLLVALLAGGDDGGTATTTTAPAATADTTATTAPSSTAATTTDAAVTSTTAGSTTSPPETTAAPTTVPAAVVEMNELAQGTLVFEPNSTTLGDAAPAALDQIAAVLQENPSLAVFVDGHTDNLGDEQENLQLSELRANTVVVELTSRGVERDRLTPRGFGGSRPVADNSTAEGQAANRRIEFTARP